MNAWVKDLKERAEAVVTIRAIASRQIENGPVLVIGISVCGKDEAGNASLWNGVGSAAVKQFDFYTFYSAVIPFDFSPPIIFSKGLYVVMDSQITSITVRYIPLRE